MTDEPEYVEPPEPEQEWNHSYTKNGLKYAAKTTIQNEHGISDARWLKLDFEKIRTERHYNPHSDSYFAVYCLEDIKRILGLK